MRSIKLNKNILKIYKKIEQAKYLLAQKSGHYPSSLELSTYLGIEETVINEIQNATTTIMSLDNDTERTIYETISSPKDSINQDSLDLQDSIKNLTPKEQDIINYRYFKDYTQSETAQILGMSQVTVSRYEKKSLTKMYNYLNI
jgi:RNA polymerase sigma factor (sigma-70 family)